MLKGQAKTDYQREYMRAYRRKKQYVRPPEMDIVQPNYDIYFSENIETDKGPSGERILIDADDNRIHGEV